MNHARVLLVNPPYSGLRIRSVFSAGLGYVAEALKVRDLKPAILDMSLGYGFRDLCSKIRDFRPDLVGISMMTYRYKETYRLIRRMKLDFPGIRIVCGGPHISLLREKTLADCPEIDFGVTLEGEETLVDLCKGEEPGSIKGLIHRRADGIFYTGDRPFIRDLDCLPFPKYEAFELERSIDKEVNALPIVSSRGCPFDCVYCPVKCSIGEAFRSRTPENIIEEFSYWYAKGYRRFSFADDNFTLIKERVHRLCELIHERGLTGLKLSCDNGVRADKVDKELMKHMKEAGFYRIAFGVEAGNDRILKNLKKREDIETVKTRIRESCGLGFDVDLFFLVGSPGETRQDLRDSFDIAQGFPIGTAFFYNIIPFPHTELYDWVKAHGRFLEDWQDYLNDYPILDNRPVFETPEMPKKDRREALKEAFSIMRKTMRRSWTKRLASLGALARPLARVYTSSFVQDFVLRNRFLRSLVYQLAHRLMGSSR